MEKMTQDYSKYTEEDLNVWSTLFERQLRNLPGKAHPEYLSCLDQLSDVLNPTKLPNFDELNEKLRAENGWSITVVPGLIPVDQFFKLLSEKTFCSSTWVRSMEQLDYLEEPDMFHDVFGHVPILADIPFTRFLEELGTLGVKFADDPDMIHMLSRIYWYTVEFGLIQEPQGLKIYGAGILSSIAETRKSVAKDTPRLPFELEEVMNAEYHKDMMQENYYVLANFEELFQSIQTVDEMLSKKSTMPVSRSVIHNG